MPAAIPGIKIGKKITDKQAGELTLDKYRLDYLVATLDGTPVARIKPRRDENGEQVRTMSPTSRHIAMALGLSFSSVRGWLSGRNTIRLSIGDLVALAKSLGLTVEQLAMLSNNSCKEFSRRQTSELKLKTDPSDLLA